MENFSTKWWSKKKHTVKLAILTSHGTLAKDSKSNFDVESTPRAVVIWWGTHFIFAIERPGTHVTWCRW